MPADPFTPAELEKTAMAFAAADRWAITALTDTGVAYLDSSAGGGCDWEPPERFAILIDPGDMITWSTEGDDSHLCIDELQVLRKAAARLEPTP